MCDEVESTPGRRRKPRLTDDQIRGAKYLRNITDLLAPLHGHGDCPNRELHYGEYVADLVLYFLTPVLDSMRGLQQAGELDRSDLIGVELGKLTSIRMEVEGILHRLASK